MKNSYAAPDPILSRTSIGDHSDTGHLLSQPPEFSTDHIEYLNTENVKQLGCCLKAEEEGSAQFDTDKQVAIGA